MRLLVEIAKKDPMLNLDSMPGIKADLRELAIKFNEELDHTPSTFDSYIEGLCKFGRGSRTSDYYRQLFPDLLK